MANLTFLNETGIVGQIYVAATNNITGSEFLTLLGIMFIIISFAFMFRLPLEFTAVLILPMLFVFMAYRGDFFAFGGLLLIYAGIIIAKNYLIK